MDGAVHGRRSKNITWFMENYQDGKLLNLIQHIGVLDEIEQESVNADVMDDVYDIVIILKGGA